MYLVKIYTGSVDDPAGARFSGFIDTQNPLVTDILLPSSTEKIFARLFAPDGMSTTTELPNYETISHTFFRSQKTAKASQLTTIACTSCSGNYNGSSWQTYHLGSGTKCITNITGWQQWWHQCAEWKDFENLCQRNHRDDQSVEQRSPRNR